MKVENEMYFVLQHREDEEHAAGSWIIVKASSDAAVVYDAWCASPRNRMVVQVVKRPQDMQLDSD